LIAAYNLPSQEEKIIRRRLRIIFYSEAYNKVAKDAIDITSHPKRTQTFTKDDFVVDTEPLPFDWDIVTHKTNPSAVQLPVHPRGNHGLLEKPRKPLSAYNIFFHNQREQIKQELAESSSLMNNEKQQQSHETHRGKILFAELARTVATRWKAIDPQTRAQYDELATQEKNRYQREMEEWEHLHSSYRHRIEEYSLLASWTKALIKKNTVENNGFDICPCGIPFRLLNSPCHCNVASPQAQPSMMQSYSTSSLYEPSGRTAMGGFDTFAAQEGPLLPHGTVPGTETSQSDRLQELAKQLGHERLELLGQIFGTSSNYE